MTTIISPVNIEDRKKIGIQAGDTVRVWVKILEKGKTRLQAFEGIVLSRKHGDEAGATFTVRKVTDGVGVEKIFPLYSPAIDRIEIVRRSKVRRAKLYYIREKVAREIRRQMRNMKIVDLSTESDSIRTKDSSEEKVEEKNESGEKTEEEEESPDGTKDSSPEESTSHGTGETKESKEAEEKEE